MPGHHASALVRALPGGVALAAVYLVLGLLRPAAPAAGTSSLAGLALGWLGWPALLAGAAIG